MLGMLGLELVVLATLDRFTVCAALVEICRNTAVTAVDFLQKARGMRSVPNDFFSGPSLVHGVLEFRGSPEHQISKAPLLPGTALLGCAFFHSLAQSVSQSVVRMLAPFYRKL